MLCVFHGPLRRYSNRLGIYAFAALLSHGKNTVSHNTAGGREWSSLFMDLNKKRSPATAEQGGAFVLMAAGAYAISL